MSAYRIISAERASSAVPVCLMCELLEVSRSGYYECSTRAPSDRELTDAWLIERIRRIWSENREVYGAPRIHAELRMAHGINVGRKRVERLMQQAAPSPGCRSASGAGRPFGCREFASPTISSSASSDPIRPTCCGSRTSRICGPGRAGCTSRVQDAFSRRIVGWCMADHMREQLVIDALTMALGRRRPDPGLIHHSDQGGQYVSLGLGRACTRAGISRSMGSKGDCFDNAVAKTFFATLKKELVHRRSWPTRQELTSEVFEYIEGFYNLRRRYSTLGMLSPADYEQQRASLARAENSKTPTAC